MNAIATFFTSRPDFDPIYLSESIQYLVKSLLFFIGLQIFVKIYFGIIQQNQTYLALDKAGKAHHWNSRIVSTIHAVMATYFSLRCFIKYPKMLEDIINYYEPDFTKTLCFTCAYLISDLYYVLIDFDSLMFIHHLVGVFGLFSGAIWYAL